MLTANGGVFAHGQLGFYGAPNSTQGTGSTVALVPTTDNKGYWTVSSSGQVQPFGDAINFGTATPAQLSAPVRTLVPTADGMGYWLVTSNGGVFSFGDATFHGSAWTGGPLDIVAAAATPDGGGYWLAGSDGRVYSFGDAGSFGSGSPQVMGSSVVVGMATTPDGLGYWLATANGGVFSFGDAHFYGSQPTAGTGDPVVSITPTADGRGYWLATAAGKVTAYGDATLFANPKPDPYTAPVVGLAVARSGALVDVPVAYVAADHQAAATCPGLSWTLLAAIGKVESDFGRTTLPGVTSGANYAGAAGPMQMGIGGAAGPTFFAYDHPVPADEAPNPTGGANPPSPYDLPDAVFAAARDLCANGAADPATVRDAVLAYNHSGSYADEVLALAATYGGSTQQEPQAVRLAMTQIGVPYVWGGTTPDVGFDCSGLVQWAYGATGVSLPRTSQEQWLSVVHLPAGTTLQPGDLLFFGAADGPTHVGIYIGNGLMVDAPHTGADVRVEPFDWSDYLGAGRVLPG
jgi:cell wall-associated NlpC family hydrolase